MSLGPARIGGGGEEKLARKRKKKKKVSKLTTVGPLGASRLGAAPSKVTKQKLKLGHTVDKQQAMLGDWKDAFGKGGAWLGNQAGRVIGGAAEKWFSKITGMGTYHVNKNTLMSSGPPVFNGSEFTEISHREYLGDVKTSEAFATTSFNINPGLQGTFPWLAQVAKNFEEYDFTGLVFEYVTTSAAALSSTNAALGVVVLTTNYDVLDPLFTTKLEQEAYQYTVSTVPCASAIHPVECDPSLNILPAQYVRTTSPPLGSDARFYDRGRLQVSTEGMQTTGDVCGELWVSYRIRLLKPKLGIGSIARACHYKGLVSKNLSDRYEGLVVQPSSSMELTIDSQSFLFPTVGRYMVMIRGATTSTGSLGTQYGQPVTATASGGFRAIYGVNPPQVSAAWLANSSGINGVPTPSWQSVDDLPYLNHFMIQIDAINDGFVLPVLSSPSSGSSDCFDIIVVEVDSQFLLPPEEKLTPQQRLARLEVLFAQLAADESSDIDCKSMASDFSVVNHSMGSTSLSSSLRQRAALSTIPPVSGPPGTRNNSLVE
jgi:hypothetical protein